MWRRFCCRGFGTSISGKAVSRRMVFSSQRFFAVAAASVAVLVCAADVWAQSLTFTTFAGRYDGPGAPDGIGSAARFNNPLGLAADQTGNLYVADTGNCTIRKITPAGVVYTLAGLAGTCDWVNGRGAAARFNHPTGVA